MPLKASKLDFLKNFEILGLSSNFSKNFNFEALSTCLILMENDQKHVFFLLYEAKFLYLFGGNFVLEDKQFSSLLTLH